MQFITIMAFIKNNWKWLFSSFATFAFCFMLHKIDMSFVNAAHLRNIAVAETKQIVICNQQKAITTEVSHDYQSKIADLNRRVSQLKRVRSCVPIEGSPATGHDAAGGNKLHGPHGVPSDALIDFAAEAEQTRLKLNACQSFIRKTQ